MRLNKPYPKGLTLMELLVVVIIIMLVMTIGTNTYRDQRKFINYNDAVLKVSNLIKTARGYALTSHSVYDPNAGACSGSEMLVPEEGYGVYIYQSDTPGESRAVLFANTEKDNEAEANKFEEFPAPCISDLILEDYHISVDADFVGLFVDKTLPAHTGIGGGVDDKVSIIFRPPTADATIVVNDNAAPGALTYLTDLYLQFRRPASAAGIPSNYIHFNRIAGFPETETE